MATTYEEYSVASEIESFFKKTSATRAACDTRATELAGGDAVPVDVQGACSYSVYAGPELGYVVQFRLESLALGTKVSSLATEIYGSFVPKMTFEGKVGDGGKEPLYVYLMSRMRGMTHLDFILAHGFPENSPDNLVWRQNLIGDIAQYVFNCQHFEPRHLVDSLQLPSSFLESTSAGQLRVPLWFETDLYQGPVALACCASLPIPAHRPDLH